MTNELMDGMVVVIGLAWKMEWNNMRAHTYKWPLSSHHSFIMRTIPCIIWHVVFGHSFRYCSNSLCLSLDRSFALLLALSLSLLFSALYLYSICVRSVYVYLFVITAVDNRRLLLLPVCCVVIWLWSTLCITYTIQHRSNPIFVSLIFMCVCMQVSVCIIYNIWMRCCICNVMNNIVPLLCVVCVPCCACNKSINVCARTMYWLSFPVSLPLFGTFFFAVGCC